MENRESLIAIQRLPVLAKIPANRIRLLFLSTEEPRSHGFGLQINISFTGDGNVNVNNETPDDPSTIYARLPVRESLGASVPSLGYYPSYSEMAPEQRGVYLRWLCDTSRSIEIGYVFVYFYGLERHLAVGDFDGAFDEVLHLIKHHENPSFFSYAESALLHSCLLRKRLDKLETLYASPGFDYFGNSNLLILHQSGLVMSVEVLMRVAAQLYGVNRRYLRAVPKLYSETLKENLRECFGKESYPLANHFQLDDVEGTSYPIFANISLPSEIRSPHLPDLFRHDPFVNQLNGLFRQVHETVKIKKKAARAGRAKPQSKKD